MNKILKLFEDDFNMGFGIRKKCLLECIGTNFLVMLVGRQLSRQLRYF